MLPIGMCLPADVDSCWASALLDFSIHRTAHPLHLNPCRSFHLIRATNSVPASYIRSFTNPFIQKPTSSHCEQTLTRNSQVETGIQAIRSIEDETSKKFAALAQSAQMYAALAQKYAPAAEFNAIVAPMSEDLAKVKHLIRTDLPCLTVIGHHWSTCHCVNPVAGVPGIHSRSSPPQFRIR